jgi:mono/diheme cytochrome c family protein
LLEVLTTRNSNGRHGTTSTLSTNQLTDLIAYLLSLDGSLEDEATDLDRDAISPQPVGQRRGDRRLAGTG